MNATSRYQWFDGCRQSNGATIQVDVLATIRPKVFALARQLDDTMDISITRYQKKLQCR